MFGISGSGMIGVGLGEDDVIKVSDCVLSRSAEAKESAAVKGESVLVILASPCNQADKNLAYEQQLLATALRLQCFYRVVAWVLIDD